jgi:hypothetical protein
MLLSLSFWASVLVENQCHEEGVECSPMRSLPCCVNGKACKRTEVLKAAAVRWPRPWMGRSLAEIARINAVY